MFLCAQNPPLLTQDNGPKVMPQWNYYKDAAVRSGPADVLQINHTFKHLCVWIENIYEQNKHET